MYDKVENQMYVILFILIRSIKYIQSYMSFMFKLQEYYDLINVI